MKNQTWGLSPNWVSWEWSEGQPQTIQELFRCLGDLRIWTINEYKSARANGTDQDAPREPFPEDGSFTWQTPDQQPSRVLYLEGPGDAEWMTRRDENYIQRLQERGCSTEQEQEDLEAWEKSLSEQRAEVALSNNASSIWSVKSAEEKESANSSDNDGVIQVEFKPK